MGGSRTDFDKPFQDYMDRRKVLWMPWHDVACAFTGVALHDVAGTSFSATIISPIVCPWLSSFSYDCHQLSTDNWQVENNSVLVDPSTSNASVQVLQSVCWSRRINTQGLHFSYQQFQEFHLYRKSVLHI